MADTVPAAAVIILSESGDEVLLVKRNPELKFMGGHHAFVGGRIDEAEGHEHVVGAEDSQSATILHAVAREAFEETGLLLVRGTLPSASKIEDEREAMLASKISFDRILGHYDLTIHAEDFSPAGRWVTPPMSPIRFDTHYYVFRHAAPRYQKVVHGEIVDLEWMRPADARARWRTGDIRISTPIAYILWHLAKVPFPKVLDFLSRPTHRGDGITSRFELRHGISIVPLVTPTLLPATHTNCIIVGEEELLVIDPGPHETGEQEHLKHQLNHLLELGAEVRAVILTHSHPDHTGAAQFVQDEYDAPIWCHRETARQIGLAADRELEDGDILESAGSPPWRLRVLYTPGHDPGHLAFIEETTGSLIGGDMVANPGTIIISREYGGDMTQYLESLDRLLHVTCNILFPAHGMPIRKPHEKIQEQITHRLWREERIKAAVDAGIRDLHRIIARAYDDVPEAAWPLAEHTAKAHLERLGIALE
jgi:ribonuclease/clavin/mitogillin